MQKVLRLTFLITSVVCITACSTLKFPWVYEVRVQQGNWVERDMVEKLEVGMTKSQVRYVMGSPLVQDTFSPDRWDYYFTIKRGDYQMKERRVTVFFEGDTLASWESNLDTEENRDDPTGRVEDEYREAEYLERREDELSE